MSAAEHDLVSKVVTEDLLGEVFTAQITARFFHDAVHGEVWDWISDFWERYGKCPDQDTLRAQYPTYALTKAPEPVDYYIEQVRLAHKRFEAYLLIGNATEQAKAEDIDGALATMAEGLLDLEQETSTTKDEEIITTWEERLLRYKEIEDRPAGLIGIPTGFETIDNATGGLQPEQLIYLIGLPKAGKSSMLTKLATTANDAINKILFFTFEMSNAEQQARHDGLRAGFNPNKILHGNMTPGEWATLRKVLRQTETNPDLIMVHDLHSTTTLSAVAAKVAQYKPDLVIVDGMYLMDSEIPGVEPMDTRALTKLSRGLKRLAQTQKIPVVATTQMLEHKYSKSTGATTGSIGYSSAMAQDADLIISVESTDDTTISRMRIVAGRWAGRRMFHVRYDWDRGLIEEMELDDGGDDLDDE
jgi:replicative DNA helicase